MNNLSTYDQYNEGAWNKAWNWLFAQKDEKDLAKKVVEIIEREYENDPKNLVYDIEEDILTVKMPNSYRFQQMTIWRWDGKDSEMWRTEDNRIEFEGYMDEEVGNNQRRQRPQRERIIVPQSFPLDRWLNKLKEENRTLTDAEKLTQDLDMQNEYEIPIPESIVNDDYDPARESHISGFEDFDNIDQINETAWIRGIWNQVFSSKNKKDLSKEIHNIITNDWDNVRYSTTDLTKWGDITQILSGNLPENNIYYRFVLKRRETTRQSPSRNIPLIDYNPMWNKVKYELRIFNDEDAYQSIELPILPELESLFGKLEKENRVETDPHAQFLGDLRSQAYHDIPVPELEEDTNESHISSFENFKD